MNKNYSINIYVSHNHDPTYKKLYVRYHILCTATNVGIIVVRNVAIINTKPHQHTCINQKCVGGTDNYSCNHDIVTRERHVFVIVIVFHVA